MSTMGSGSSGAVGRAAPRRPRGLPRARTGYVPRRGSSPPSSPPPRGRASGIPRGPGRRGRSRLRLRSGRWRSFVSARLRMGRCVGPLRSRAGVPSVSCAGSAEPPRSARNCCADTAGSRSAGGSQPRAPELPVPAVCLRNESWGYCGTAAPSPRPPPPQAGEGEHDGPSSPYSGLTFYFRTPALSHFRTPSRNLPPHPNRRT